MKVPFFKPCIGQEEKDAVLSCMDSGWLTTGKVTLEFEKEFASYVGSKHALAVNSNTSGMILAMEACGVKAGKAVITTPYTFVSTAASALHLNGEVFFADIQKDSYSIDPDSIEKILKQDREHKICAIVPVHIAGNVCDMAKICELAARYSTPDNRIYVIEDCAHSFPSKTSRGFAGTLGDAGIFSFYATKTMTTGEGGMVTTNNDELAKRMKTMRLHGMNRDAWDRYTSDKASFEYDIVDCGFKCNLPDVLSAIGREQLKKAESFRVSRTEIARVYNQTFKNHDVFKLPPDSDGNAWHLYLLRLDLSKLDCDRNTFAKELQDAGIGISMHFIAIFNFSYWKKLYPQYTPELFPNAQEHYLETISLPFYPFMTDEERDYVIKTVIETGEKHRVR